MPVMVHIPELITSDMTQLKQTVVERNLTTLRGDWPADSPFLGGAKHLIGDPNAYLSEHICHMLFEEGILSRHPDLDENGKQRKIKLESEELLWEYSWAGAGFESLDEQTLVAVAWDLRNHPNFCHISVIAEQTQTSLDTHADEEHDDSASDENA